MANSVDPEQTAPIGAVCSGSTVFASILNSSVMLGNYLQQTTSADDYFRCIFSWRLKGQYIFHPLTRGNAILDIKKSVVGYHAISRIFHKILCMCN